MSSAERQCEDDLIEKLIGLKYTHRPDVRDRAALEANFRQHFQAVDRVTFTDAEFDRLLAEIVTADIYAASQALCSTNSFTRDNGTPINYTLVFVYDPACSSGGMLSSVTPN